MSIEQQVVESVIEAAYSGETDADAAGCEPLFVQLIMTRLWDVASPRGVLSADVLEALGGPARIAES